jgi:L-threonate 2-dehydrogenase
MSIIVAVVAAGEMGAGVGQRLVEKGARVLTSLDGRSKASAERVRRAGMAVAASDAALVAEADFVLSIVPPGAALALAERLMPALRAGKPDAVYVDCNAVAPKTAERVAAAVAPAGRAFVDGGIIGGPPKPGGKSPRIYVSGEAAPRAKRLGDYGLDIRVMDGPIGAASGLKMGYASITKGFQALGATMMLGASAGGVAPALQKELAASEPMLFAWLVRRLPAMFPKAYRWVAEMEEIGAFMGGPGQQIFEGAAGLYARIAASQENGAGEVETLRRFITEAEAEAERTTTPQAAD